ncbi:MAG: Flp pilus assembly complex ATPase component TadA [Puniceicoccaceae bacterium]|nr:Flp pilus assembly complex ATPase component TadA [Puniceicoccaceae bacterium]
METNPQIQSINGQASENLEAWLLSRSILTTSQAELAQREGARLGLSFSEVIQRLGLVTSEELSEFRSMRGQLRTATDFIQDGQVEGQQLSLRRLSLDEELRATLPAELCEKLSAIPVAERDGRLWIACANPFHLPTIKRLETAAQQEIEVLPASETDIRLAINRNYKARDELYDAVGAFIQMDAEALNEQSQDDPPMIRLAEQILMHAATREASDIHLHPEERFFRIRLRVDGVLEEGLLLPSAIRSALTARFKILAGMDIAEDRLPQDGRIRFAVGSEEIDVRVSSLPSSNGESVVMRLLDQSRLKLELATLGFSETQQREFEDVLEQPHGVFLITGPTGSGKTTTLYTLLSMVDAEERSVFTLEDPIEYRLPLIRQTQIKDEIGLSFANGLRTLLRQDPDVILVGETRDQITAELMIRAALTGHLVFSTLHTNDAISAVPRLKDLGIPSYLLSSSLIGLSAQRLARRLCPVCKSEESLRPDAWLALGGDPRETNVTVYKAVGCQACSQKGYNGRISLAEIIRIDSDLRKQIDDLVPTSQLKRYLYEQGAVLMRKDGLLKAEAGLTSIEEVGRVIQLEAH